MKRICTMLLFSMLLLTLLPAPVHAWTEYGVIYDETESLWSEELNRLGTEILPGLTSKYNIDMRVDILCDISGYDDDLEMAAPGIYENYDYGSGEGRNGVTLTLLVHTDDTGVALDGWIPYAGGDSIELTTNGTWNICRNADQWLTEEAWSGDLDEDIRVLTGAVRDMAEGLESFVLAGGVHATIWDAQTQSPVGSSAAETEPDIPETEPEAEEEMPALNHITDTVGLLTEDEWQALEQQAFDLGSKYDFGVYVIVLDDYTRYAEGDIFDTGTALYHGYALGSGSDYDGLLLLLSTNTRDYTLVVNGHYGNYAFNGAGREALTAFFLDNFKEDDWYGGFSDYLTWAGNYLEAAAQENPYNAENLPTESDSTKEKGMSSIATVLLLPLIPAFIVLLVLNSKMKSVETATKAAHYLKGSLELTDRSDRYTHTTETRKKIEKESSKAETKRSGSTSGTSGKF